jgi:hypothetical protein
MKTNIKKILSLLIVFLIMLSCSHPSQTEQDLRENINKPIRLEMFETVRKGNIQIPYDDFRQKFEFLSVVYLQNGCQSCYPKFIKWQQKMDSVARPENHSVLFIILGNSYENFMTEVLNIAFVEDHYYTIMDTEFKFLSQNSSIPKWIIDSSVLIDSENKIKMVGAPWINEDMKTLFYETVKNEQKTDD